jgi:molecular chaperone HscB
MTEKHTSAVSVDANGNSITAQCWSCGDMRAAHFCNSCGHVQPPRPVDYFSFFGLLAKLNIDTAQLEREFYKLSRKLHPDLSARHDSHEQEWSLEQTSQLNDAYRTLKDPILRTEYLLKLEGVHLEEQSKTATDAARDSGVTKKQVIPPELLEEVFELNMQLEEARMNKKMGERDNDLDKELQQTKQNLQQKHDALMSELKGYWDQWDALVDRFHAGEDIIAERNKVRDNMVALLNRRTYIRNLLRDVDDVLGI